MVSKPDKRGCRPAKLADLTKTTQRVRDRSGTTMVFSEIKLWGEIAAQLLTPALGHDGYPWTHGLMTTENQP